MTFKELCAHLREDSQKVRYWANTLLKKELIEPKDTGSGYEYSEVDIEVFEQIQAHLENGAKTLTEAIRFYEKSITPSEALDRHEALTNQLKAAQRKVLDLRRDPWWKTLSNWIKTRWSMLFGNT